MISLVTPHLYVRNFSRGDWHSLFSLLTDKESSRYALYDHPMPTTPQGCRGICEWFSTNDEVVALYHMPDERLIGYVCLYENKFESALNLSCCVHSSYQRKGYAYEACQALINHAFSRRDIECLSTSTAVENIPYVRLLQKLGFVPVAQTRQSFRTDEKGNPREFDEALYILPRESQRADITAFLNEILV